MKPGSPTTTSDVVVILARLTALSHHLLSDGQQRYAREVQDIRADVGRLLPPSPDD